MARQHEGFFAGYDSEELAQPVTVTLTQRDLVLIRTALGISLDETSRHDHIYNDIHALLAKLPPAPQRKVVLAGGNPDERLVRRSAR
jgi:hypothetical protein